MTKEIKLRIESLDDIKEFVKTVEVNGIKANVRRGILVRNASSLLGILSIDPSKEFILSLHSDDDFNLARSLLKKYIVGED